MFCDFRGRDCTSNDECNLLAINSYCSEYRTCECVYGYTNSDNIRCVDPADAIYFNNIAVPNADDLITSSKDDYGNEKKRLLEKGCKQIGFK